MVVTQDELRTKAKAVIAEIVRASGGLLVSKTRLFKAFWRAHVEYAKSHAAGLTRWPVVRMPMGPGIDNFDTLLGEMLSDGLLHCEEVAVGQHLSMSLRLVGEPAVRLTVDEQHAVDVGADFVRNLSAAQCSEASHVMSLSWRRAKDGERLNLSLDTMDEAELDSLDSRLAGIASQVKSAVAAHSR